MMNVEGLSKMINEISKKDYPELWSSIIDDIYEIVNQEHRRGSNFYANMIFCIDEEFFPNNPELHGYWMSNTIIWDSEYGFDDEITVLHRVKKVKKVIETEEWLDVT